MCLCLGGQIQVKVRLADFNGDVVRMNYTNKNNKFNLKLSSRNITHAVKVSDTILNGHFVVQNLDVITWDCMFCIINTKKFYTKTNVYLSQKFYENNEMAQNYKYVFFRN